MRMRPLFLVATVVGGCFDESPNGEDPTGSDTTSATDPSMSSTSTASTTTVDPMTASATGEASSVTDPTDMTMTTDGPTSDPSTSTTDDPTDSDTSSSTGAPVEEIIAQDLADACAAIWTNDLGAVLDCPVYPGEAAAPSGHAFPVSVEHPVTIESTGVEFEDEAMLMHPRFAVGGELRGRYPGDYYVEGDAFRTHVYCVQDVSCSVELAIAYSIEQAAPAILTSWAITADDDDGVPIDFVLAGAGYQPGLFTELSLIVMAGPDSASDSILLDRPRIVRFETD